MTISPTIRAGDPDSILVRRARADDLAALVDLEQASFTSDRLSPRQWKHHIGSASANVLVVDVKGQPSAAAVLFFRRGSQNARLYSLAVSASVRGHGFGEALLTACEHAARDRGCLCLRLEVRRDNAAAMRLYRKRGYDLFASRPGYYEDGEEALCFEKALTSHEAEAA